MLTFCNPLAPKQNFLVESSRGGLEVEQWTDNSTISISVGSNPARSQKYFRSNSNTTGDALVNNVKKLMRLSLLD